MFSGTHKLFLGVLVLVVSALSCSYSVDREIDALERSFIEKSMEIQRDVIQRVANLDTVLTALVGQHHSSDFLSSAEQTLFSQEMLKAYPFIHSILYLERVTENDLPAFEQRMHDSGFISYHLDQERVTDEDAALRGLGFHLMVSFIEPMQPRSANLLGFDLASLSPGAEVLEKSIRSGSTIALGGIQVPHFDEPMYFILKPVYLGRYPPTLPHERWKMLSGFEALWIDFRQFFEGLQFSPEQLSLALYQGTPENYPDSGDVLVEMGVMPHSDSMVLKTLDFVQPLEIHGLSFTLSIQREIDLGLIDVWRVGIGWLISMMILLLIVAVYRNRRYVKLQEKAARAAIAEEDARLSNVIDAAFDAVITADHQGHILSWNQQATELFGYDEQVVLNRPLFSLLLSVESLNEIYPQLEPLFNLGKGAQYRKRLEAIGQHKNGQHFSLELALSGTQVGDTNLLSVFARDITERKRWDEQINYLAYCDSLTDLPNRQAFKEQVSKAIQSAIRYGRSGAVLYLDLDEFKRINDTLGHDIGDMLLKHITQRLEKQVRGTDTVALYRTDTSSRNIARLGGDEFTVLLDEIDNPEAAATVAKRVQGAIARSYNLNGHEVYVTPSIGIAVFPRDGQDVEELLKNADTAMYHAKAMGKNNFQFYTEQMNAYAANRLKLEGKLRRALISHEMELYYQPQIDLETGEMVAAEALLRWHQPELGMIPPGEFIPLAEETGMIIELGEWVLQEACRQNKVWQDAGYAPIRVAINLSSMQFIQRDLSTRVARCLAESGLQPEYLEFEITETIIMRNVNETITTLDEFKKMGISISVDDFGTGYSSLSYLKRFPLDVLKVDRSFVKDIPDDQDDVTIASAIIAMAHQLGLGVVAEGVETEEQLAFLRQQGCELAQGYHFSKPLPAYEFELLLTRQDQTKNWAQQQM
ncbi:MAG: EAL domain-containing protein [Candidatus Thiodiazotropha sp.]